jgi:hypothetical protein
MAWRPRSYRGPRTGHRDTRVAQEPGRPCHSHRQFRLGNRNINSPEPTAVRLDRWEQNQALRVVSPSEGNEARRDGRQGV